MIVVCSINDLKHYREWMVAQNGKEPHVYRTTAGKMPFEDLPFFHPSWDIVMAVKDGRIGDEKYLYGYWDSRTNRQVKGYYEILKANSKAYFAFVKSLRANENYILLCFCREGTFCHRHIIADKIEQHRPDLGKVIRH